MGKTSRENMFRLFFLIGILYSAPVPNHGKSVSYRVNTVMKSNGGGHIDLTSEDYPGGEQKSWDYDWDELTITVKDNINNKLKDLSIDGGLTDDNQFVFGKSKHGIKNASKEIPEGFMRVYNTQVFAVLKPTKCNFDCDE